MAGNVKNLGILFILFILDCDRSDNCIDLTIICVFIFYICVRRHFFQYITYTNERKNKKKFVK